MSPEAKKRRNARKTRKRKIKYANDPEYRHRMLEKGKKSRLRQRIKKDPNYLSKIDQKKALKQEALKQHGLSDKKILTIEEQKLVNNTICRIKYAALSPEQRNKRIQQIKDYWSGLSDEDRKAKTRKYVREYRKKNQ